MVLILSKVEIKVSHMTSSHFWEARGGLSLDIVHPCLLDSQVEVWNSRFRIGRPHFSGKLAGGVSRMKSQKPICPKCCLYIRRWKSRFCIGRPHISGKTALAWIKSCFTHVCSTRKLNFGTQGFASDIFIFLGSWLVLVRRPKAKHALMILSCFD